MNHVVDGSNWDERHQVTIKEQPLGSIDQEGGDGPMRQTVALDPGGDFRLETLYEPGESDTLIVSLHGAQDRSRFAIPRFEWRRTLSRVEAGKLYLSDSTLALSRNLEIGWYVGSQSIDLIEASAEHIIGVAKSCGYSRIVCIGSSAGGFAAIAISRRISGSIGVAFSPQTAISAYQSRARKMLTAVVFPDATDFLEVEGGNIGRTNMRRFYAETENTNYLYYVQNSRDEFHYAAHYVPFALGLGVDPEVGGKDSSGRYNFIVERQQPGHAPPSRGRFLDHLVRAHQDFFGAELTLRPRDIDTERLLGER